jgi:hypothetical protein
MKKKDFVAILCSVIFVFLLVSHIPLETNSFLMEISAENRNFEVEKFNVNISISASTIKTIDLNLVEGDNFEVVYTLQVKENLPIDVWLVNEDNYLLLISDVNFLYFIDGSDQEVTYTKKIVTFKEEGLYKLVMANLYNNQTITVNAVYEIRTFNSGSEITTSEDLSFLIYPLIIVVVVLAILSAILFIKNRKLKHIAPKTSSKPDPKKKTKKRKPKKVKPKITENPISKAKSKEPELKEKEPKETEKTPSVFCGNCGKPVTTLFCKNCGKKV